MLLSVAACPDKFSEQYARRSSTFPHRRRHQGHPHPLLLTLLPCTTPSCVFVVHHHASFCYAIRSESGSMDLCCIWCKFVHCITVSKSETVLSCSYIFIFSPLVLKQSMLLRVAWYVVQVHHSCLGKWGAS